MTTDPAFNRPVGRTDSNYNLIPDSFSDEAFRAAYTGANLLQYKAFAKPGANIADPVWQIAKLAYDGSNNLVSITWPVNSYGAASNDYEFIWDNGAGTNYTTYTYI